MDLIEPDGCRSADRGWAGNPLDTAHLRLRLATAAERVAAPEGTLCIAIEQRLNNALIGFFKIDLEDKSRADLHIHLSDSAEKSNFAGEALRRCLRMLFDNFGIGLVKAKNPSENQDVTPLLRENGFTPTTAGDITLVRAQWQAWRNQRKILWVAAAALIDEDGRVLLAQRPAGKSMAGQWEFPGGKLNEGETPEQALIRELHEELAIDVTPSCLAAIAVASHDYDHFHLVMPLFAIRQWSGRPTAQEGQNLAWVTKDRFADFPVPPADIPLIAQLRDWL